MLMKIEVWSDVVCPFCYVGKRRLEAALTAFPHRDAVEVVWRSFELNADAPTETAEPLDAMLARSGAITRQTTNAQQDVARHKADLERLEERMTRLLERYTRQFSVVESIVGNTNSLRTGLTSSFEGLMAMYKR